MGSGESREGLFLVGNFSECKASCGKRGPRPNYIPSYFQRTPSIRGQVVVTPLKETLVNSPAESAEKVGTLLILPIRPNA